MVVCDIWVHPRTKIISVYFFPLIVAHLRVGKCLQHAWGNFKEFIWERDGPFTFPGRKNTCGGRFCVTVLVIINSACHPPCIQLARTKMMTSQSIKQTKKLDLLLLPIVIAQQATTTCRNSNPVLGGHLLNVTSCIKNTSRAVPRFVTC